MKNLLRILSNLIFGIRRYNNKFIKSYASNVSNKTILEIGSGKQMHGENFYSAKKYFDETNVFIQSDINKSFGHKIIDITTLDEREQYDIILCMNVLEHVFNYQLAISNLYNAVRTGGHVVVFLPGYYPLHDEPHDYWRFTEHSIRKIFSMFSSITLEHLGIREYPIAYGIILKK